MKLSFQYRPFFFSLFFFIGVAKFHSEIQAFIMII